YKDFEEINIKRRSFIEVFLVTNELMEMSFRAYQFEQAITSNPAIFEKAISSIQGTLSGIHKNYDVNVDRGVFENVMPFYTDNVDATIYNKTALTSLDSALKLFEGTSEEIVAKLNKDAAYAYAKPFVEEFYNSLNPEDRKSTRLNSSHVKISYAVFCLKKKEVII